MPQAGQRPHHQQVADLSGTAAAVAAQGDIDIVAEPGGQAHVPPPPELGDGAGQIRIVEVFGKGEAKHPPQADGHVAVGGKVKVDLQRKAQRIQPGIAHAGGRRGAVAGCQLAQDIGDEHLFSQPHDKAPQTGRGVLHGQLPLVQLGRYVGIADDRPGHQLGKQTDIGRQRGQIALGVYIATIDIDGIAHGLKGEKADAHRQRQVGQRNLLPGEAVPDRKQKVGIFEHGQQPQVEHNGADQRGRGPPGTAVPLDIQAVGIVRQGRAEQQQRVHRLAPIIEPEADRQQNRVTPARRGR